jgi:hypothetical protein
MAEIKYRSGKSRKTHRRPKVVNYDWIDGVEYEVLECGHKRLVEEPFELEDDGIGNLVGEPRRRICLDCPTR